MNFNFLKEFLFSAVLIATLSNSYSQTGEKRNYKTTFTETAPQIDGLLNDKCWDQAEWTSEFIQSEPKENVPPAQQTAFKILYDDNNLYIFIRAFDNEPDKIIRHMTRRDNASGDMVRISIDSYYDKQTAFMFGASVSGTKADGVIARGGNNWDMNWNPIWFLKTSVDAEGWCAEMKIPLNQLRFGKQDVHVWGFQVERMVYRSQEVSQWQFIPKGSPQRVSLFGELNGIENIMPKRKIEIVPYTVARMERFEKEEGNPFLDGKSSNLSAGVDGKIGLTNDITLDFSINPDFGQVEADPSEVNLTAFETYFSEKRPLFIEGSNIYQFQPSRTITIHNMQADNLFYSRRIGQPPHGYPETIDNEYVKMPESTTILGAAKVSGKTKKGLSIGILESLTSEEKAVIDNEGVRRKETVEPLTNYFVGRLQQDFNKGETVVGAIFTSVNKDIDNPSLDYLHTDAYSAGIDFQRNWKERTWYLAGNAEFSNVRGKPEAIINTQRSSARYYQRPDANYLSVDSSLTSLAGYGSTVKFGRGSNKKLQFETSATVRSPGLEFNDIGYMRSSDIIHHAAWVAYYIRDPFLIFNNFYMNTNYWMYWNFSGKRISTHTNINFYSQFKNLWSINGNFSTQSENISTTLLRGGPSFVSPGNKGFNVTISTNESKKVAFYIGNYHGAGDVKSYKKHSYWGGAFIKPTNSMSISLSPSYDIQNNKLQYVRSEKTGNDTRYLFGTLDQKTFAFIFRANYTITPELTIEYYGQPFVSAGKYSSFKRITVPDADKFNDRYHVFSPNEITYNSTENNYIIDENADGVDDYSFGNPDYNFRQFRSNLVVRWEYLPGSTIYLVWSQGRTSSGNEGVFSYGSDMKDLFHETPHNVFLVKFSYWFSL